MAQYFDSGSDVRADFLGAWCEKHIVPGIQTFRAQFGYFSYEAFANFAGEIRSLASNGQPVHMVIGSNSGSLSTQDLQDTLDILSGGADTSLIVVRYSDVLFHPKVLHLTQQDGSAKAVVGSVNFTPSGLGGNVEAFVDFHDQVDDATLVKSVADSIDNWKSRVGPSVFQVTSKADINALEADCIINVPQPPRVRTTSSATVAGGTRRVMRRGRLWRPPVRLKNRGMGYRPTALAPQPSPSVTPSLWCKELKSSDAQRVSAGTNPTGKLRLTQSNFGFDHRRYFRYIFFGNVAWAQNRRNATTYDEATVTFDVYVRGVALGQITLLVDHAPHREAGQGNVTTTLGWGTTLNAFLVSHNHIGDWVVLERKSNGTFELRIEQAKPTWAP